MQSWWSTAPTHSAPVQRPALALQPAAAAGLVPLSLLGSELVDGGDAVGAVEEEGVVERDVLPRHRLDGLLRRDAAEHLRAGGEAIISYHIISYYIILLYYITAEHLRARGEASGREGLE